MIILLYLIMFIVMAIWALIGFFLWIPFLVRMISIFVFAIISSMFTGQDPTPVRNGLAAAVAFYANGFILIRESIPGNDLSRFGFQPNSLEYTIGRVLGELAYSFAFWAMTIGLWYAIFHFKI